MVIIYIPLTRPLFKQNLSDQADIIAWQNKYDKLGIIPALGVDSLENYKFGAEWYVSNNNDLKLWVAASNAMYTDYNDKFISKFDTYFSCTAEVADAILNNIKNRLYDKVIIYDKLPRDVENKMQAAKIKYEKQQHINFSLENTYKTTGL